MYQAAYRSLADPPASSVLLPAVSWLEGTLIGSLATVAVTIAIAAVGFLMLSGRINLRYGATVILGSFVLFGASTLARGIQGRSSAGLGAQGAATEPRDQAPLHAPSQEPPAAQDDPYAGASVPTDR
jgi:type IV secretion system protein VirB2